VTEKSDRFTLSYAALVGMPMLLFIFGHDLDRIFGLSLLLVPLILIPTFVVGLIWLAALFRNAVARRWRRVASIVTAPPLAFALLSGLGAAGVNPESIRFAFGRPSYVAQIANLPKSGEPRFKLFDWGDTGGAGVAQIFHTLIYDESDEIALSADQRSASWRSRMGRFCPGSQMCSILEPKTDRYGVQVRKMDDHFYLMTETFW
jgi:hypothetical protein